MSALLPGPVGGHLVARVPTGRPEETVAAVRERLHTEAYDATDDVLSPRCCRTACRP